MLERIKSIFYRPLTVTWKVLLENEKSLEHDVLGNIDSKGS